MYFYKWKQMKILIIDDDKKIANMYKTVLETNEMQVTVSLGGKKGLELIEKGGYDAILLDIAMPDFSGYDVMDALEKKGKLQEHKIIIVTASVLSDDAIDDLKKRGVFDILPKPVAISTLLNAVK